MIGQNQFPKDKLIELVIIYPCRVVSFDKTEAFEVGYGEKVTVENTDQNNYARELVGLKRAVLAKDFTPEKYPCPPLKVKNKDAEPKGTEGGTSEKPLSKMNVAELTAFAAQNGIQVPPGATKAQILELITAATE